jgi:hypothetical protein
MSLFGASSWQGWGSICVYLCVYINVYVCVKVCEHLGAENPSPFVMVLNFRLSSFNSEQHE